MTRRDKDRQAVLCKLEQLPLVRATRMHFDLGNEAQLLVLR